MHTTPFISAILASLSFLAWVYLLLARGSYWRVDQRLDKDSSSLANDAITWPSVSAVIPARNEADLLPKTLPTLLSQDYPGPFHIFLVDDQSTDGAAEAAWQTARDSGATDRLTVCAGKPLPPDWKGKVWAMAQGVAHSEEAGSDLLFLTDADIAHEPYVLRSLVAKLCSDRLDLVSLMATLRVKSGWDRLLIPAFVYFFSKVYPFRWVNDPQKRKAGAARGCILVRRNRLQQAGGLSAIANAIIDDCALGKLIKHVSGRIWMGMTQDVKSLRPYESLESIWNMVARTAYDQLFYSPLLLVCTVVGMLSCLPVATGWNGLWSGRHCLRAKSHPRSVASFNRCRSLGTDGGKLPADVAALSALTFSLRAASPECVAVHPDDNHVWGAFLARPRRQLERTNVSVSRQRALLPSPSASNRMSLHPMDRLIALV